MSETTQGKGIQRYQCCILSGRSLFSFFEHGDLMDKCTKCLINIGYLITFACRIMFLDCLPLVSDPFFYNEVMMSIDLTNFLLLVQLLHLLTQRHWCT